MSSVSSTHTQDLRKFCIEKAIGFAAHHADVNLQLLQSGFALIKDTSGTGNSVEAIARKWERYITGGDDTPTPTTATPYVKPYVVNPVGWGRNYAQ